MKTSVLLLVFNRPQYAEEQIRALRQAKPPKIFISADGPRKENSSDKLLVDEVKKIFSTQIDWDCDVQTNFFPENQGCGLAPSRGITWFFEQVEEGIILEDDCIPDPSFFRYSEELLELYRDDHRIMSINGGHFPVLINMKSSYYFSYYPHLWGWATWRRAWDFFEFEIQELEKTRAKDFFAGIVEIPRAQSDWAKKFFSVANGKRSDVWDYQWVYTCWKNRGLAILPTTNMVENIGFGEDSTHTFNKDEYDSLPSEEMNFPLNHPRQVSALSLIDEKIEKEVFLRKGFWNIFKYRTELLLPRSVVFVLKHFLWQK